MSEIKLPPIKPNRGIWDVLLSHEETFSGHGVIKLTKFDFERLIKKPKRKWYQL